MPDANGNLTVEDKDKVKSWLKTVGWEQRASCPVCGHHVWTIADHLVQPVTLGPQVSVQLGGVGYPQVMLISSKCGYTIFLNAVIMGLLPASGSEK